MSDRQRMPSLEGTLGHNCDKGRKLLTGLQSKRRSIPVGQASSDHRTRSAGGDNFPLSSHYL